MVIVSVSENEKEGMRLLRLTDLLKRELSGKMGRYVTRIIGYADLILGKGWRN